MFRSSINLKAPYLIFFGDVRDQLNAKTGLGVAHWAPERCAGQMKFSGCRIESGLPNLGLQEALKARVRTVIIGVAPTGGQLKETWLPPLLEFARAGIDIAAGLHSKLADIPELVKAAQSGGARLVDVRIPPANLPCGSGRRRTGKRVLTVGTDCAVGKKYSALALHRELVRRGIDATFRATGQTGIMIAGEGIPIDAVVADFVAGAAEVLSPDNDDAHWDVIEGQGSLVHPGYAGVTLGLMHGSQPDALVLCHDASRDSVLDVDGYFPIPPLDEFIDRALTAARLTNPECLCAGISVNTSMLTGDERAAYLEALTKKHGMPAVDPIAIGVHAIADYLLGQVR
ncbi:MAG: DUF1611 domain-containing protein [Gammaproteobacteria bacterium]|nr:DUF1611 domain-containing protein [Gammaproteobacteria bacterium]NNC57494.1 DUF1611 domain-containing protein [Woeseiaceae bacterium]NNL51814.1 DUF1611 domain-containing protein [Woeseiaceae bacterium]